MFDFVRILEVESPRKNTRVVCAKFIIGRSTDIMIRGGDFYAAWLEDKHVWTTDMYDVLERIDQAILDLYTQVQEKRDDIKIQPQLFRDGDSGAIEKWYRFCQKQKRDEYTILNETIIFADHELEKEDYATFKLPYALKAGEMPAYEKLVSTLYSPEERHKLEWCIGSIVTGDSKKLQKFAVLYGATGTGKSTMLNIVEKMFRGYCATFEAKALGSNANAFAMEAFRTNPLVAIQHDGDLSRIEDNTRLNSLVSHEEVMVNEKFKSTYANSFKAFLFMGTNHPVRITDAKSGLLRRLIDITPTGNKVPVREYNRAVKHIDFELGAIASHCQDVYLEDPSAYDNYVPLKMMGKSNDFYNFMLESYPTFKREGEVTLAQAWEMYKAYVEMAKVPYSMSYRIFQSEMENYFDEIIRDNDKGSGATIYKGFRTDRFEELESSPSETEISWLELKEQDSIFDQECMDLPAQYANDEGTPVKAWAKVKTTLKDLDTHKLHYVNVPENHIIIDFDIRKNGEKDLESNLKAAASWPPTYAETSKSGGGLHLHYIYDGDVSKLSSIYSPDVEVKVYSGNQSLRRLLTVCNAVAIRTIASGLPLKGDDRTVNLKTVQDENHLRALIMKAIRKEVHPDTTENVNFIKEILDRAANTEGLVYDVSDLKSAVIQFAANSTNHADYCLKQVTKMVWMSEQESEPEEGSEESPLIFYDCEVFPNLFLVNWKIQGDEHSVTQMINPDSKLMQELCRYRLVGFNNRRYDNHMLYARMIGYTNEQLYELSQKIVTSKKGDQSAFFREAYNLSYTDIYDFSADKKSLKKWEIELDIHHQELGLPWDQPVPEELWLKVAEYCDNDVIATEAVFNHLRGDFTARRILAKLAGGIVNDTTNTLTQRLMFGRERHPQLVYTDLATGKTSDPKFQRTDIITGFPGYEFKNGQNWYRGTNVGRGGYIVSNPGVYTWVKLLDIKSMHPHSAIAMNMFGDRTKIFEELVEARVAIKEGRLEDAKKMMGGMLVEFLEDPNLSPKDVAQALKIAINAVYGQTAASYENPFRDIRNKNNIVALRGALFMRTLEDEIKERGFSIVAIKTDSIKIANATEEIVQYCLDRAKQYGYEFDVEDEYERMCQINDADYIARHADGTWTATGARFGHPLVFKKLFSGEPVVFKDYCETKEVKKGAIHMKMGEDDYKFIGRIGSFVAVPPEHGGKELVCINEDKISAVSGTKGFTWLEAEQVKDADLESYLDMRYYRKVMDDAKAEIQKYCDFENFRSGDPLMDTPPWYGPDGPWDETGEEFDKR